MPGTGAEIDVEAVVHLLKSGPMTTYDVAIRLNLNDLDVGEVLMGLFKSNRIKMERRNAYGPKRFTSQ
jgi:hypothetical protein